jgi:hypothetical protein
MDINNDNKNSSKEGLKIFFIKLISISIVIVFLFDFTFAERLEKIDKILLLNSNEFQNEIKQKIRKEINSGLSKENLISEKDKILLYKLYQKLEKEFQDIDKSKF